MVKCTIADSSYYHGSKENSRGQTSPLDKDYPALESRHLSSPVKTMKTWQSANYKFISILRLYKGCKKVLLNQNNG